MFEIFKNKGKKICSICNGITIPISNLEDEAFASKALGDGIGIKLNSNIISSPIKGEVAVIFNTKHAFVVKSEDGLEILVHIGFDTVKLNGEGFEQLIIQGDKVEVGTPIIKIDKGFIESKGYTTDTAVVITNMDIIKTLKPKDGGLEVSTNSEILKYSI